MQLFLNRWRARYFSETEKPLGLRVSLAARDLSARFSVILGQLLSSYLVGLKKLNRKVTMKIAIFFALFVASAVSEDGKKWAKKGKTAILDCTYEKDVKFCQWKRPDAGLLTFAGQPGVEQIDSNPRFK